MKMYIAVLDEFPDYMTPTLVGHAVLGYHLEWQGLGQKSPDQQLYTDWLERSFKKCVIRVNQKELLQSNNT